MKHWQTFVACLMVLVLVAAVGVVGCGEDKEEGKVTIKIGYLTDLTGPAAPALIQNYWAIEDAWEYLQETDPIAGAELQLVSYDTALDAARTIPGYEWLKARGVLTILAVLPSDVELLPPFLTADKFPAMSGGPYGGGSPYMFQILQNTAPTMIAAAQWVENNWPNYPTVPKVGLASWSTFYEPRFVPDLEEYCLSRPDKFEWVGAYLAPQGTMTWSGEVEKLKDCDYVFPVQGGGVGMASFIKQYRDRGHTAVFIGGETMPSFIGMIVDVAGWEAVDKTISNVTCGWWSDGSVMTEAAKEIVARKHPGETLTDLGYGYISMFIFQFAFYNLLKTAIEDAGAENVTRESLYESWQRWSYTMPDGRPAMQFTDTRRIAFDYARNYEWSAAAQDLLLKDDWFLLPLS